VVESHERSHLRSRAFLSLFPERVCPAARYSLFQTPRKLRQLFSRIFFVAGLLIPPHLCFWIYFANFVCKCINSCPMLMCKSANLFGLLLLAEVVLMLRFSLITMSYITRTRRFILRGPRLPSVHSLGAYLFTHLSLGIVLGILPLHRISGLVAGIATGSTTKCLWNREVNFKAKALIR
jgi:hypothetical protein